MPALPVLGRTLHVLLGDPAFTPSDDERAYVTCLHPPPGYDFLLRHAEYALPHTDPLSSPWVDRALNPNPIFSSNAARRYKPVARKVRPVAMNMPDLSAQALRPIILPPVRPLPTHPPPRSAFKPTERLTLEHLNLILDNIPDHSPLSSQELDLLIFILSERQGTLAFTDNERGTFSREYFPDYVIPVIEHTPWVQAPIPIPKAIETKVARILDAHFASGRYELSCCAYRSAVFPVEKKNGDLRLVHDLQHLNSVTIRDASLPPRPDDFAESFVGYACYGVADLFSGYDARTLDVRSRDLTTFQCMDVSGRCTVLPQGATNAVSDFVRCTRHILAEEIPEHAKIFVDDCGIKGPRSRYHNEPIPENENIRRFVFEYLTTFDRVLWRFEFVGVTVSGYKLVPYTLIVHLVGSDVSQDGWHLHHGVVSKILKWPYPTNVSEVRCFLGIAGVARRWTKGFSLVARPLTSLCRKTDKPFTFSDEARAAVDELKARISSAPVLIKVDYDAANLISRPISGFPDGLIVVSVDGSKYGAGWVLYQFRDGLRHPALFGSCTYSAAESRYSQPKVELYGVFRAVKELRTRVWGIHFLLESDAQFLEQTLNDPDLPNAPMTRWVAYLQLFDYEFHHIPSEKGRAQDALSRRPPAPDDSDESDGEAHLDEFFGHEAIYAPSPVRPSPGFLSLLIADMSTPRSFGCDFVVVPPPQDFFPLPASSFPDIPLAPSVHVHSFSHLGSFLFDDPRFSTSNPAPSMLTSQATLPPLLDVAVRRCAEERTLEFLLGDAIVSLPVTFYRLESLTPPVHRSASASATFIEPAVPAARNSTFHPRPFGTEVAPLAASLPQQPFLAAALSHSSPALEEVAEFAT
ncbi:hypothetical protein GSI_08630 [Ganoderma sinense ZZ0214-1]|uniref:Reverse transcriptase RNase H-like domain-containing protein n=1 Tax=Ganoderma sinense ZZ0214-1 TaxID=1077348 RepID=A0A2G8S486_9APHY|nr:hypothetical protein GSI_08630 [Ganoderma sinense ZZ0214-1]